jgi:Transposase DDE domain
LERIPIEGKFGQGKNGYRLNYIRAKTAQTSEAWIRAIFLVMNLMVLFRCWCVRKTGTMPSHFLRYIADRFLWLLQEVDGFNLAIFGFAQTKMIF